jgi:hypothetical protein
MLSLGNICQPMLLPSHLCPLKEAGLNIIRNVIRFWAVPPYQAISQCPNQIITLDKWSCLAFQCLSIIRGLDRMFFVPLLGYDYLLLPCEFEHHFHLNTCLNFNEIKFHVVGSKRKAKDNLTKLDCPKMGMYILFGSSCKVCSNLSSKMFFICYPSLTICYFVCMIIALW